MTTSTTAKNDAAELLSPVIDLALEAGSMIRTEALRPEGPRGHGDKAEIDTEVEIFLKERLMAMHIANWRGEETDRQAIGHTDTWVVDPQDGTTAFLNGHRGSAVSIALVRDGLPVLGVVHAPLAPDHGGDLFHWAEGAVAMRNGRILQSLEAGKSISLGPCTVIAMNETAGDHALANHLRFGAATVIARPSIAYRLALAAAGEADAAISLTYGLDSYDIAAGHALLCGVGGELCDLNGVPVRHDNGGYFRGCVGGRPDIVREITTRQPASAAIEKRNATKPLRLVADPGRLSRAQGAMIGLFAGDALGSQVEFRGPRSMAAEFPDGLRDLLPGGTWNLLAGQPTDDGELALALARAIVAHGGFDACKVGDAYVGWLESKPFDIGTTTRIGIEALRGYGRQNDQSQANGGLMRVAPIGILAAGDPASAASWARMDARLTHPHPVCEAASAAFVAAIAAGIDGADAEGMADAAHAFAGDDQAGTEIRRWLREARDGHPDYFTANEGWVRIAFGNAFHRLIIGQDFADALVDTVMQGGDTDTNGAICGALLGAAQGRDAIPQRWRSQVLGCRAVNAPSVRHPRPKHYFADDALELAEALLALAA